MTLLCQPTAVVLDNPEWVIEYWYVWRFSTVAVYSPILSEWVPIGRID